MGSFHKSILVKEILDILSPKECGALLIDGTLGEGGHALAFLKAYPTLKVIGIDADSEIQEVAKERLASFKNRITYYLGWSDTFFQNYPSDLEKADSILFDLGISMYHYTVSKKGFSFNADDNVDMRLSNSSKVSAKDIINFSSKEEIVNILRTLGEERYASLIATSIIEFRNRKKIETSKELSNIIFQCVPKKYRYGAIHPATKTFQALRIKVNEELARLPNLLHLAFSHLKVGGRLGVITFHSLEDRIVKHYFKELIRSCICPPDFPICQCGGVAKASLLTKKAISPSEKEVEANHASRSAKFRAIEKIRD